MQNSQDLFLKSFNDPAAVARYTDGPRRFVPGLDALHRMTGVLLAERVPADARILVLGAGGGMEMRALADAHPGWTFEGVDPAGEMLKLAQATLGPHAARASLVEGYIEDAGEGPFDGAACLLTLHFLPAEDRKSTAAEIHRRLRPGAPFISAHCSFPQDERVRDTWLSRYAAFANASGADPEQTRTAHDAVRASLNAFNPEQDEAILAEAGFKDVACFYSAFTWRGWVSYA